MKKTILLAMLFCSVALAGNAQLKPNLKGAKEKLQDKVDTPSIPGKSSGNSADKVVGKANGEPAYDPEDPTYRAFSIVRDEINSTKNIMKPEHWDRNVAGRNEDATRFMAKAKENLTKLQNDPKEAKKQYVSDLAKSWDEVDAERQKKFDNYTADELYKGRMESYQRFAMSGWEIHDPALEPSYSGYYKFKSEFETTRPEKYKDDYVQGMIAQVDNYFKVEVYKVVPEIESEVNGIISQIHEKNSDGEERYMLNAKHYLADFTEPMEVITYNRKYLLEDKTGVDAIQAKIDKEKAMLEEYINSGKYDAHVAKYRQAIIDAVRLAPKKMSNAKYEAMATSGVDKGKVNRVAITSDVWTVKKNDYGLPLYKYLPVDIAVTVDGVCWLAYGQIRKEYEGGGVYGGEYFNYWGLQDEMNCANISK